MAAWLETGGKEEEEEKRGNQDGGCNWGDTAWGLFSVTRGGRQREKDKAGRGRVAQ